MSKNEIINVSGLIKKFGHFKALDGLNLSVEKGQVHGFLGPNGAGKSTTIRILLGLLQKTDGVATLFGEDPWKKSTELHRRLAYVPGEVNFWPNLSGGEIIDLLGDLRGGLDEDMRAELVKSFQLETKKKFRTYSKGNRQKVALIAALTSDVELYVLDEPTSGLDPLMEAVFQKHIHRLKKKGKTVLLSSHILAEVDALCDYATLIRNGKTVATGALKDIQHFHRTIFEIETKKSAESIAKLKGVHSFKSDKNKSTFEVEPSELDEVMKALAKMDLAHITSHPPKLEQLFMHYYNDESGDNQ